GPVHSPHVAAQIRLAPGERFQLDLSLTAGSYVLRSPQLSQRCTFRVDAGGAPRRCEIAFASDRPIEMPAVLRVGGQRLALENGHPQELVVRIERTAPRDDAVTAARLSSLALFRELFPHEVLAPDLMVSLANVTWLTVEWADGLAVYAGRDDARSFRLMHDL